MTTFGLVHGAWYSGTCWDASAALQRALVTGLEGGHSPMLARPEVLSDALTSLPA